MTLNDHVLIDTTTSAYVDIFYPESGYALWDDTEEANLDENGVPLSYWLQIQTFKRNTEAKAPHIWAKLIDETMEVFGNVNQPAVMALGLDDEEPAEPSHTYIDENGVEQMKKGVY